MPVPAQILAAIRQPAFAYLADGGIGAANDRAEALAGGPLAGMTSADVIACFLVRHRDGPGVAPSDLPAARALAGEEAVDVPLTITAAGGRTMHVLATASPIRDGDRVAGALSIWQDVTGEVEAARALAAQSDALQGREEEIAAQNEELRCQRGELREQSDTLRESEAKYRGLVDLAPDGVVVHERGVIRYANPAAARLLRATAPDALVGTNILELVHPDDRTTGSSRVDTVHDRSQTTPLWEFRFMIDGEVIPADAVAGPVTWEGAPAVQVVLRDITARKRAEAALGESEARHRRLFETMLQGVVYQDTEGMIVGMNPAAEQILGKSPAEFLGGSSVGEERHTLREDGTPFPGLEHPAMVALRTGEAVRDVVMGVYNPRDRAHRWISVTAVPLFHPGETAPYQVYTLFADITERKRMGEALRESDARQGFLVRLNDALAPLADPAGVQAEAARVLGEHLGADRVAYFEVDDGDYVVEHDYAPSVPRIAGRHPIDSFGPRLLAVYRSGTTAVGDDVEADPDLSPDKKAGFAAIQIRAYIGVPLVKAGAFVAGLAVHTQRPRAWTPAEVSLVEKTAERTWAAVERAKAETALRESERRFRSVLDHSLDALYRLNLRTGRYEYVSPAFDRAVGRTAEEMLSRAAEEAKGWVHPNDLPVVEAAVAQLEETGATEVDYRVRDRDGRYRRVSNHLSLVRDGSGRPLYRDGIVRDVTGQKEAEEALREYAENLQRSNEDLQRFAYVASHDLQEPLRSVVSFSQLLERRYGGQLGPDADEYIDFIVEGGNRMQSLILDLLAFSRVNTTRQQIARTDAEDVLAEAVRSLDLSLREADATLTHDSLPVVMADPTQLAQVFSNLVSNAVKFRRPDAPLQVHVGARRLDGVWEFSVSDNGIGIAPEYFDRIFVIFQRLHTKETYPGTGIGLAIVKRIIDRHDGTIRVESTPGEGSTFFFTLPAA